MSNFVAIDFETANAWPGSICQVGIAVVEGGEITSKWSTYIDPDDYFDVFNIGLHGINEETVAGSPSFAEAYEEICSYLDGNIVISHGPFDTTAFNEATNESELDQPEMHWLSTIRVARRVWLNLKDKGGYGLANLAGILDIPQENHHDACEDAVIAAQIMLKAIDETGLSPEDWLERVKRPVTESPGTTGTSIKYEANIEGNLYGYGICFTGTLSIPRSEAQKLAAEAGCEPQPGVSRKTDILVIGEQDMSRLKPGAKLSNKHEKALNLINQGCEIRVLTEKDFFEIINLKK